MNLSAVTPAQLAIMIAIVVIIAAGTGIWVFARKRRTEGLRTQFGSAEYSRTLKEGGSRQKAEAALDKRTERVEGLHIRPLSASDRARFVESWDRIQARFVDGPGGAISDADQLIGDVM